MLMSVQFALEQENVVSTNDVSGYLILHFG